MVRNWMWLNILRKSKLAVIHAPYTNILIFI
jgi:hypothetical protein